MENTTPAQLLLDLESFRFGTLLALIALKAAIQESPGFNQAALEECVTQFLALPPERGDRESFEGPLKALLNDHSGLLRMTSRQG